MANLHGAQGAAKLSKYDRQLLAVYLQLHYYSPVSAPVDGEKKRKMGVEQEGADALQKAERAPVLGTCSRLPRFEPAVYSEHRCQQLWSMGHAIMSAE